MIIKVDGFDWDDANIDKCKKHGISIVMIEEFFSSEIRVQVDGKHSASEE